MKYTLCTGETIEVDPASFLTKANIEAKIKEKFSNQIFAREDITTILFYFSFALAKNDIEIVKTVYDAICFYYFDSSAKA